MSNLELYHYGVKGMKWGVRKNNNARKKNKQTNKPHESIKINRYKKLGYIAGGLAISMIGAKIATDPKVVGFVAKGMKAVQQSKINFDEMGPVIVDKFGNIVDIDL